MLHFWLTSKMSHAHGRHGSCGLRFRIQLLRSVLLSLAGGVTDVGVGSGALFGERRRNAISEIRGRGSRRNTSGLRGINVRGYLICATHHFDSEPTRKNSGRNRMSFQAIRDRTSKLSLHVPSGCSALIHCFLPKFHRWLLFRRTSKLSHARGRRDSCGVGLLI